MSFDGEGEALEEVGMSDAIAQVASAKRLTPTVMANFLQEMQVQQMRMWQVVMAKLNDERKMATAKADERWSALKEELEVRKHESCALRDEVNELRKEIRNFRVNSNNNEVSIAAHMHM